MIDTNEILYRIKKALNLTTKDIIEAYNLEEYDMDVVHLKQVLKRRKDSDMVICSYEELGVFLDGLVSLKRGKSPKRDDGVVELTNNLILKKLRVALELKEPEIEIIFALVDITLTKQQLSALFRKEDNKNFKACSDELLISFLEGLDEFYFVGELEE
ncbi:MAG: DUF1456 family protein [Sulfurovum sp.]